MRQALRIFALWITVAGMSAAWALERPSRVAVDASTGNTFVVESPYGRTVGDIVIINAGGQETGRIRSTGSTTADPRYFSSVGDLALGANGHLYVLDTVQRRLLEFSATGTFVNAFTLAAGKPTALVALPDGGFLIAESSSGVLVQIDARGQFVRASLVFDLPVPANEAFDIALVGADELLVTDPANHRVIKLDISAGQVRWLGWLGACNGGGAQCVVAAGATVGHTNGFCSDVGSRCGFPAAARIAGGFQHPSFIATDPSGGFYVTDLTGIYHFDANGTLLSVLPSGIMVGQTGRGHIHVSNNGDLYVADTGNNRVNRFSRTGAPVAVVGGGVIVEAIPGKSDVNRLVLTEQDPTNAATVNVTSLGYTGAVTLSAAGCLRETESPPFRSCTSYGISNRFAASTLNLAAGQLLSTAMTVSANQSSPGRALNGRYLVAVAMHDAAGRYIDTGQVAIQVAMADKVGIVADPGQVTIFPGDPDKEVAIRFNNVSGVAGALELDTGVAPMQAAGQFTRALSPNRITTSADSSVSSEAKLRVKAAESARSGNPKVTVTAKRGSVPVGTAQLDVQIDCACRDTGAFVEPEVLPVRLSTTDPQTGTSPSGRFTVHAAVASTGIAFVEIPGRVSQVSQAVGWGFSPNEKYFVVATQSLPEQVLLQVYDLAGQDRSVAQVTVQGCSLSNAGACAPPPNFCYGGATSCLSPKGSTPRLTMGHASWGFSPDDKTLLVAQLDVAVFPTRQYLLYAYDLSRAHSGAMLNQQFGGGSAFWRFSPCGDIIMHFEQTATGSAITREASFWRLDGARSSSRFATARYADANNTGGAPAARAVPASSLPNGSAGDFDIALTNLVLTHPVLNNRTDGFQSLQCRAR